MSEAARGAGSAAGATRETQRVETLLDRNEALPDPRALARMYKQKSLLERLPDDDDHAPSPAGPQPDSEEVLPDRGRPVYTPPTAKAPGADTRPSHAPLSPAQIREVMNDLREQFTAHEYATYEARSLPEDVIPFDDEPDADGPPPGEPREIFYVIGTIVAILVIGVFILLALGGPLRYRPPASTPSPHASAVR